MIDVNVSLSRWPCRRLPHNELPKLVEKLRQVGVTQAWAGMHPGLPRNSSTGHTIRISQLF